MKIPIINLVVLIHMISLLLASRSDRTKRRTQGRYNAITLFIYKDRTNRTKQFLTNGEIGQALRSFYVKDNNWNRNYSHQQYIVVHQRNEEQLIYSPRHHNQQNVTQKIMQKNNIQVAFPNNQILSKMHMPANTSFLLLSENKLFTSSGSAIDYMNTLKNRSNTTNLFLLVLICAMSLLTVCGNILVVLAFIFEPSLRTNSNFFILNLSIADLLVGLVCIPLYAPYIIYGEWLLSRTICQIWLTTDYVVGSASVLCIVVISMDRCLFVTKGLQYKSKQTRLKVILTMLTVWLIAFLNYGPAIFLWSYIRGYSIVSEKECQVEFYNSFAFLLTTACVEFFVPFFAITLLNAHIYVQIKKRSKGLIHSKTKILSEQKKLKKQKNRKKFGLRSTDILFRSATENDLDLDNSCSSNGQSIYFQTHNVQNTKQLLDKLVKISHLKVLTNVSKSVNNNNGNNNNNFHNSVTYIDRIKHKRTKSEKLLERLSQSDFRTFQEWNRLWKKKFTQNTNRNENKQNYSFSGTDDWLQKNPLKTQSTTLKKCDMRRVSSVREMNRVEKIPFEKKTLSRHLRASSFLRRLNVLYLLKKGRRSIQLQTKKASSKRRLGGSDISDLKSRYRRSSLDEAKYNLRYRSLRLNVSQSPTVSLDVSQSLFTTRKSSIQPFGIFTSPNPQHVNNDNDNKNINSPSLHNSRRLTLLERISLSLHHNNMLTRFSDSTRTQPTIILNNSIILSNSYDDEKTKLNSKTENSEKNFNDLDHRLSVRSTLSNVEDEKVKAIPEDKLDDQSERLRIHRPSNVFSLESPYEMLTKISAASFANILESNVEVESETPEISIDNLQKTSNPRSLSFSHSVNGSATQLFRPSNVLDYGSHSKLGKNFRSEILTRPGTGIVSRQSWPCLNIQTLLRNKYGISATSSIPYMKSSRRQSLDQTMRLSADEYLRLKRSLRNEKLRKNKNVIPFYSPNENVLEAELNFLETGSFSRSTRPSFESTMKTLKTDSNIKLSSSLCNVNNSSSNLLLPNLKEYLMKFHGRGNSQSTSRTNSVTESNNDLNDAFETTSFRLSFRSSNNSTLSKKKRLFDKNRKQSISMLKNRLSNVLDTVSMKNSVGIIKTDRLKLNDGKRRKTFLFGDRTDKFLNKFQRAADKKKDQYHLKRSSEFLDLWSVVDGKTRANFRKTLYSIKNDVKQLVSTDFDHKMTKPESVSSSIFFQNSGKNSNDPSTKTCLSETISERSSTEHQVYNRNLRSNHPPIPIILAAPLANVDDVMIESISPTREMVFNCSQNDSLTSILSIDCLNRPLSPAHRRYLSLNERSNLPNENAPDFSSLINFFGSTNISNNSRSDDMNNSIDLNARRTIAEGTFDRSNETSFNKNVSNSLRLPKWKHNQSHDNRRYMVNKELVEKEHLPANLQKRLDDKRPSRTLHSHITYRNNSIKINRYKNFRKLTNAQPINPGRKFSITKKPVSILSNITSRNSINPSECSGKERRSLMSFFGNQKNNNSNKIFGRLSYNHTNQDIDSSLEISDSCKNGRVSKIEEKNCHKNSINEKDIQSIILLNQYNLDEGKNLLGRSNSVQKTRSPFTLIDRLDRQWKHNRKLTSCSNIVNDSVLTTYQTPKLSESTSSLPKKHRRSPLQSTKSEGKQLRLFVMIAKTKIGVRLWRKRCENNRDGKLDGSTDTFENKSLTRSSGTSINNPANLPRLTEHKADTIFIKNEQNKETKSNNKEKQTKILETCLDDSTDNCQGILTNDIPEKSNKTTPSTQTKLSFQKKSQDFSLNVTLTMDKSANIRASKLRSQRLRNSMGILNFSRDYKRYPLKRSSAGNTGAGSASATFAQTAATIAKQKILNAASISLRKDKRAARSLFILVFTFVCCWAPYTILTLIKSVCTTNTSEVYYIIPLKNESFYLNYRTSINNSTITSYNNFSVKNLKDRVKIVTHKTKSCINEDLYEFSFWLLWFNSTINPILYPYLHVRFRKAFYKILGIFRIKKAIKKYEVIKSIEQQKQINKKQYSLVSINLMENPAN
ncbi:hypothetical protein SNEBB_010392 [Seison nebaliae]|nr:hypothetical protein SNEBB_010392 [Seison nebaliae]